MDAAAAAAIAAAVLSELLSSNATVHQLQKLLCSAPCTPHCCGYAPQPDQTACRQQQQQQQQ
jgi:hypothetical protein